MLIACHQVPQLLTVGQPVRVACMHSSFQCAPEAVLLLFRNLCVERMLADHHVS